MITIMQPHFIRLCCFFNGLHVPQAKIIFFVCILSVSLATCRDVTKTKTVQLAPGQTPLKLVCAKDSLQIVSFIRKLETDSNQSGQLFSFYQSRNYVPAWISSSGPNENAGNFINFLNNERITQPKCVFLSLDELQKLYQSVLKETSGNTSCNDSLALKLEVLLTLNFFEFAARNWKGVGDEILRKVNWFILRKQINYTHLLNDYLSSKNNIFIREPVYRQYTLLKTNLKNYSNIQQIGGWQPLPPEYKTIKPGDSSQIIKSIKRQLRLAGDLDESDTTAIYNITLEDGVKKFQIRHGLIANGIINKKTYQAMQVTVQDRIYQILINMERCKWVPVESTGDYLVVNIPDFRLYVYENNKFIWSCNAIVGKSNPLNNTIIFNDSVEFIVFNPYWNIPKNILRKETLPAIKNNLDYLNKNNLEVVDNKGRSIDPSAIEWDKYKDHFPYIIRQQPGKNNSLGLIKFLFPNPYDIYMHDTPAKSLFNETSRTFSHGCIRIEEPFKLAQFLLREDTTWTEKKINSILLEGKETFIKLKKKVPVFIAYFTCWVDKDGKINFRDDVYGHDLKMKKYLFVN